MVGLGFRGLLLACYDVFFLLFFHHLRLLLLLWFRFRMWGVSGCFGLLVAQ